jgi:hypothetical protein
VEVVLLFKEEIQFIDGCIEAIMKRDISQTHILYCSVTDMTRKYKAIPKDNVDALLKQDEEGHSTYYLCFIGEELIDDFYVKANGDDHLARQWCVNALRYVINCGLNAAEPAYRRPFPRRQ